MMPQGLPPRNRRGPGALSRWGAMRYEQAMARQRSEPRSGKRPASPREARLAEALRANLRRRKAQRRAREESEGTGEEKRQEEAGRR